MVNYGVNGLANSVRDKSVDDSLIAAMKKHGTWQLAPTLTREAADPHFDRYRGFFETSKRT